MVSEVDIEKDVKKFLENGGKITKVGWGVSGKIYKYNPYISIEEMLAQKAFTAAKVYYGSDIFR